MNRIRTKPSLWERMQRNPPVMFAVVMIAFFAFIGFAEFASTMLGAAFDVRAG